MGERRLGASENDGDRLGDTVSEYVLEYEDGSVAPTSILRRFAIQQARCTWGSAPFACVPAAADPDVVMTTDEAFAVGRNPPQRLAPTRVAALANAPDTTEPAGLLWIYALRNERSTSPLLRLICHPREQRSAIYAVTLSSVVEHPLRPGVRRKLRLQLPDDVALNAIGEVDEAAIGVDLGVVISARAALDYDHERW